LNDKFCGNCEHLSLTEQEQNILKRRGEKYPVLKQVFHNGNHPNIVRLAICEQGVVSKLWGLDYEN